MSALRLIRGSRSFSGHSLDGDRRLRLVYLDEAGTSTHEPVTVVAGVIINADRDWKKLENYLLGVRDAYIPVHQRDGCIFHAKDISAGNKIYSDKDIWPIQRRQNFIKEILYARPLLGFSVSVGIARNLDNSKKNSDTLIRHLMAYSCCLLGCESYMRDFGDKDEIATIIAEDTPTAKKHIKRAHLDMIDKNSTFPDFREYISIRHIVDTVHFAEKKNRLCCSLPTYARLRFGATFLVFRIPKNTSSA